MSKIFISYSSKNPILIDSFKEFLQLAMGIGANDIFCTDNSNAIKTGDDFINSIRENIRTCDIAISLITEEYLDSCFCQNEMGAVWVLCKHYFPLILVPYDRLKNTPIQTLQLRKLNNEADMSTFYDELLGYQVGVRQTAEFNKHLPRFIQNVSLSQSPSLSAP